MKQTATIFLIFISSTLFAQKDSSENCSRLEHLNLIFQIKLDKSKSLLFSDSNYRNPFYKKIPTSVPSLETAPMIELFHLRTIPQFEDKEYVYQIGHSETFLFYQMGSANTQSLFLKHIQKINQKISAIAEYSRNKSDGFCLHQEGKSELVNFQMNFIRNPNYTLLPYFHYSNQIQNENGGIKSDSIFSSGDFSSTKTLETNINSGKNEKQNISGGIQQKFIFKSQSIRIHHDIGFHSSNRNFSYDPSELFYDTTYLDSVQTKDKYFNKTFYSDVKLFFIIKNLWNRIGIRSEYSNYNQNTFDTTSYGNKGYLVSEYYWNKSKLNLEFNYVFTGFNSNNYSFDIQYKKIDQRLFSLFSFQTVLLNQTPDIYYFRMDGNHFQWNNSLVNYLFLKNQIDIKTKFGELNLIHELTDHYIFLNENREVIQSNENLQWFQVKYSFELDKKKIFWRGDLAYQKVISGENFYRVPNFSVKSDFRYKTKLKAMDLQVGLIAFYSSSYYANVYDPALGNFYIQNEIKTGNYPILDFFIQSKVKTVDIKISISHFNSGFTGFNYYSTPLYPIAPRSFNFGLSWHFTD